MFDWAGFWIHLWINTRNQDTRIQAPTPSPPTHRFSSPSKKVEKNDELQIVQCIKLKQKANFIFS